MKISLTAALLLVICCFTGTLQAQNSNDISMTSGGKLKPLQAIMDIRHYTIALDVDIDKKAIKGYTEIELILTSSSDTLLFDFTHILKVTKIMVDNKVQPFMEKEDQIYITKKTAFTDAKHSVRIYYEGNPTIAARPPWSGGFTWTKDKNGNPWVNIACQFEGGKIYFPCKDHPSDEPNEGADLFITIPKGLSVAGPGLLQSVKTEKNNTAPLFQLVIMPVRSLPIIASSELSTSAARLWYALSRAFRCEMSVAIPQTPAASPSGPGWGNLIEMYV